LRSARTISAVVPVYNEGPLLRPALSQIDECLARVFESYEIIVVESGSDDGSGAICDELSVRLRHVSVIHEGARRGFGSALRLGYAHATSELLWLVTVDLPFPLETIERALPLLDRYECILSYRSTDPRSRFRRLQSAVFNLLVKRQLGLRVRHVNSAFKLLPRSAVEKMPLQQNGWLLDAEILHHLDRLGVSWTEIPVPLVDRTQGTSSIRPLTVLSMLRELAGLRRALRFAEPRRSELHQE